MPRSYSLAEKLSLRLDLNDILSEVKSVIATSRSPARFDSQAELQEHLVEGNLLNINTLGSKALAIPSGEYVVWVTDTGNTMLVPTQLQTKRGDVFPRFEQSYEVLTKRLVDNWNKVERVLAEEMSPEEYQEQKNNQEHENEQEREEPPKHSGGREFTSTIDMSTVDRTPIARAMQERGISVTELAAQCGVDPPAISRILREPQDVPGDPGGRNPSMGLASKICSVLRLDPKAAFPDFFRFDTRHHAREQPGNRGSGMTNRAASSVVKGDASRKWTQGSAGSEH